MKRRVRSIVAAAIAILIAIGVTTWWLAPRNGLLDHATRLTSTKGWDTSSLGRWQYAWLNDREVLYTNQDSKVSLSFHRKVVLPPGIEQPAADMNLKVPASSGLIDISPDRQTISYFIIKPNPKSLLGRQPISMLLSLRTGKDTPWTGDWLDQVCWAPDSKGIVSVQRNGPPSIHIRSFDGNDTGVLPLPAGMIPENPVRIIPLFLDESGRLVCVENGPYFLTSPSKTISASQANLMNSKQLKFSEVNIKQPNTPLRTWSIPVPSDASQGRFLPSPQHDRLLWIAYSVEIPLVDIVIRKIVPKYKVHPRHLFRWQVSKLDGKHLKDIACFEVPGNMLNNPSIPQWTLDGTHISFIYNSALYTIPVR